MIVQFRDCSIWNVRVPDILILRIGKESQTTWFGCNNIKAWMEIIIQSMAGTADTQHDGLVEIAGWSDKIMREGSSLCNCSSEKGKERDSSRACDETGNVTVCRAVFSTPWSSVCVCVGVYACRPRRRHPPPFLLHSSHSAQLFSCSVYSSVWWGRLMDLLNST